MHILLGLIPQDTNIQSRSRLSPHSSVLHWERIKSAALRCFVLNSVSVRAELIWSPLKPWWSKMNCYWRGLLVQGGAGMLLLAQSAARLPIFIFISLSTLHSILPHGPHLHTYTVWFQIHWPLWDPVFLAHQGLTRTGLTSTASVR